MIPEAKKWMVDAKVGPLEPWDIWIARDLKDGPTQWFRVTNMRLCKGLLG